MNSSSLYSDSTFQTCPSQPSGAKCRHVDKEICRAAADFAGLLDPTLLSLIKIAKEST